MINREFKMVSEYDQSVFEQKCGEIINRYADWRLISSEYMIGHSDQHGRNYMYAFFVFERKYDDNKGESI